MEGSIKNIEYFIHLSLNAWCILGFFFTLTFAYLLSHLVLTSAFPFICPNSPTSPPPRKKQTSTGTAWSPIKAKSCRWVISALLHLLHLARGPNSCPVQRNTMLLWLEERGFRDHSLWPISIPLHTARRTYLNINHQTLQELLPPTSMMLCYLCTSEDLTMLLWLRKTLWVARSTQNALFIEQTKALSTASLSKVARASFSFLSFRKCCLLMLREAGKYLCLPSTQG